MTSVPYDECLLNTQSLNSQACLERTGPGYCDHLPAIARPASPFLTRIDNKAFAMATALSTLSIPLGLWFLQVSRTVTEPYLVPKAIRLLCRCRLLTRSQDEFFHVRQAKHYCRNEFEVWDPKITTPPGLYFLSYGLSKAIGCDINALRAVNIFSIGLTLSLAYYSYRRRAPAVQTWITEHSALNIALLPTLFFFAALYYTDVSSTLSVLLFYVSFIGAYREGAPSISSAISLVVQGLISLLCRQTNIFWVAVFPTGLVLFRELDNAHPAIKDSMHRQVHGFGSSFYNIAKTSWKMDAIYDPPVQLAWLDDYFKTILSLVVCSLKAATQPRRAISLAMALWPFVSILAAFAVFVLWNGGVVLGDKSNHVATIHLPQMLYLWPYITFFSWPLVASYLLLVPVSILARILSTSSLEPLLVFSRRSLVPRVAVVLGATIVACIWVRYNTIVHPFTLADNRHYTFYVFRLLLRHWWVKYAVTPLYVLCGWSCIQALGDGPVACMNPMNTRDDQATKRLELPDGDHAARVSFVLVWIGTSALSLITAPLVEPRYMILPWIFWRLHVPHRVQPEPLRGTKGRNSLIALWKEYDQRLWLETAWFLVVNLVTGYIFLKWGFSWLQEPDKTQRFMW